ncbi:MAG: DUF4276 family protein [Phototrophicaceae bacterium]
MATLFILCEGETESEVVKQFLYPYWSQHFDRTDLRQYSGAGELKTHFKKESEDYLRQNPEGGVLCLLDLYEEPFRVYDKAKHSHAEGFQQLKALLEAQIDQKLRHRFGAFPVVMEIETWLLADPKIQNDVLKNEWRSPETVEHPAQVINGHYRKGLGKLTNNRQLFPQASAKRVYDDNCPHFKLMIDWLVNPFPIPVLTSVKEPSPSQLHQQLYDHWQMLDAQLEQTPTDEALEAAIAAEEAYYESLGES